MAWERHGGREYFYTGRRQGNRVVKSYHGRGVAAYALWVEQQSNKRKQAEQRQEAAELETELWPLDRRMRLLGSECKRSLHALYLAAGYSQTKCHHWRRLKGTHNMKGDNLREATLPIDQSKDAEATALATGKQIAASNMEAELPTAAFDGPKIAGPHRAMTIEETIVAVKGGRNDLRPQLRRLLRDEDPEIRRRFADVTTFVVGEWASKISSNNPIIREAIVLEAAEERRKLLPYDCSPVERMIADRVVLTRLQSQFFELTSAAQGADMLGTKIGDALDKRLKSANHEFREATRHLAQAKELQRDIAPGDPNAGAVALKLFDPESKKGSVRDAE